MQFDDESKCWNYSRRGRELRVMGNIQNFKEQGIKVGGQRNVFIAVLSGTVF